jgi:hypothetical protein
MTIDPPQAPRARVGLGRRIAKRAGIVLGVALTCMALLCCGGVAYIAYDVNRSPREERDMEVFATALCQDLLGSRPDAVYAALSADARDLYSAKELADGLLARGVFTRCAFVRATYLFLLVAYVVIEDDHGWHTFDLIKEGGGEWKVDSDILHDLDSPPSHGGGGGFDD